MTHDEQMKSQELADKIQELKLAIHKSWVEWIEKYERYNRFDYGTAPSVIIMSTAEFYQRKKEIGL